MYLSESKSFFQLGRIYNIWISYNSRVEIRISKETLQLQCSKRTTKKTTEGWIQGLYLGKTETTELGVLTEIEYMMQAGFGKFVYLTFSFSGVPHPVAIRVNLG